MNYNCTIYRDHKNTDNKTNKLNGSALFDRRTSHTPAHGVLGWYAGNGNTSAM